MSYHDNAPNWKPRTATAVARMDEAKQVKQAAKELDPANYGEDVAEKIAEECCEKLEALNPDTDITHEEGRDLVKKVIKETVKENL